MTATHENAPPAHLGSGADEENTSQVFDSKLAAPQAVICNHSTYTYKTDRSRMVGFTGASRQGRLTATQSTDVEARLGALLDCDHKIEVAQLHPVSEGRIPELRIADSQWVVWPTRVDPYREAIPPHSPT